ncbi:DUF3768 domain-containing protein [Sphingomonas mesophila]|uniref:DUF3768 domain-containing protein n=1 Tax=Sphingomonas mesophila TaxID=2303576 RepID=UPI000E58DBE0|nr:DUF3768 domain-containing protein [Sphingomonas mesophila]
MTSGDQDNCAFDTGQNSTCVQPSISELNDRLRRDWVGGRVAMSAGVEQLGLDAVIEIFEAVNEFEAFTPDNDPYGEHDFGVIKVGSERIIWKIDYYDTALESGSPDPSNPAVTTRVLTVMLASEY